MYITEIVFQRLVDPVLTGILTYGCFARSVPIGILQFGVNCANLNVATLRQS